MWDEGKYSEGLRLALQQEERFALSTNCSCRVIQWETTRHPLEWFKLSGRPLHLQNIELRSVFILSSSQVISNVICNRELSKVEHVIVTLFIVAVCTAISLGFDCLGVVLALNVSNNQLSQHVSVPFVLCIHACWCPSSVFYLNGVLFYYSGGSVRHTTDLHHSLCMLPQALLRPLVSDWKLDTHHSDTAWHICNGHRFDNDWPHQPRLFTRRGDVLLCRRQCLRHCTTCMKEAQIIIFLKWKTYVDNSDFLVYFRGLF